MALKTLDVSRQVFDYILVLDFEATCDDKKKIIPQEIIEFPILMVDTKSFEIHSTFHQYVEPQVNKNLSEFCTNLTGITNQMINGQPNLEQTLKLFDEWLKSKKELTMDESQKNKNFTFLTCGDWDLKTMLPEQCKQFNIMRAEYFKSWINLKKAYCKYTGTFPRGMTTMLDDLDIKLEGRHHSGIDDCRNIAKIVKKMGMGGHIFKNTTYSKS